MRFEYATTRLKPTMMKFVVVLKSLALVPIPFVDAHHSSRMNAKSPVGEIVRRIGKNHVNGILWERAEQIYGIGIVEDKITVLEIRLEINRGKNFLLPLLRGSNDDH